MQSLDIAIRDAWLRLRESENVINDLVDTFISDDDAVTYIARCSGLQSMKAHPEMGLLC